MKKTTLLTLLAVGLLTVFSAIAYFTYSNQEIRLKNQIAAQQESNEAFFDVMWKIIQQQAEVSADYRDSFKEIYTGLIDGRYDGNGRGQLMSWIQESNPNFSTSLYEQLMVSIKAERKRFFVEQQKLIDLSREHNNLLEVFPSAVFLASRDVIDITVIKSLKTQETYNTGKEELAPLFTKE